MPSSPPAPTVLLPPRQRPEPIGLRLTRRQAEAVDQRQGQGPLVIVGAPGSGTTTALLEVVLARIERDGVRPEQVLVLGPGRQRTAELRERLSRRLGRTLRSPVARTPHSFAFGLLRARAVLAGAVEPRLISGPEQDQVLGELLAGHQLGAGAAPDWPATIGPQVRALVGFRHELRDLLMRAVERGLDGPALARLGRRCARPEWVAAAAVLEEYLDVTALADAGAFDPAAIVDHAARLLAGPGPLPGPALNLVAVDAAQELTAAGERLVRALGARGADLVLAGDPDAAVEAFRGARPRFLAEAGRLTSPSGAAARVVVLDGVLRHGVQVREAVARVSGRISSAGLVAHREAVATGAPGQPVPATSGVQTHLLASASQEASFVAAELRAAHIRDGLPWEQMAVVARSASALHLVRRVLATAGVPVATGTAEVALRDEPAVVPLRLALRAALDPASITPEVAVLLLTGPLGDADTLTLRRLRQALLSRSPGPVSGTATGPGSPGPGRALPVPPGRADEELARCLAAAQPPVGLPAGAGGPLLAVHRVLAAARQASLGGSVEQVLWALWEASGLAGRWERTALAGGWRGARADRDLDAVLALFEAAGQWTERLPNSGPLAFLDEIEGQQLPADTLAARTPGEGTVSVLSAAAAAGREWDLVLVPGVQEGVWPDLRLRDSLLGAQALSDLLDDRVAGGGEHLKARRRAVLDDELRLFCVAVSRARRRLVVTAVRSEEELPSPFLDLVDGAVQERSLTVPDRAMTFSGLVAELRSVVTDAQAPPGRREQAATELARLAAAGVPGAHPRDWYALGGLSVDRPLVPGQDPVRVSPSSVEAFSSCALRWLLDRRAGGARPAGRAQAIGDLVHGLAQDVPDADPQRLTELLEERLPALGLADTWVDRRDAERCREMVRRLTEYVVGAEREGRRLRGVELTLRADVGRAQVAGRVDRLEEDAQGRVVVVDWKTGRGKPSAQELARHAQLGVYQAVSESQPSAPPSGGAVLVQLGGTTKKLSVQQQPPLAEDPDPGWARELLERTAEGMAGASFPATVGEDCRICSVRRACPAQPQGRQVGS